ncbi:hypothetical protein ACNCXS_000006 [Escherichia coli]
MAADAAEMKLLITDFPISNQEKWQKIVQHIKLLLITLRLSLRAETEVLCFLETFQRDLVFNPKPGWRFFSHRG